MRDTYYPNLASFVELHVANMWPYQQGVMTKFLWVPDWWRYPPLIYQLDALWRAYENARRQPGQMMIFNIQRRLLWVVAIGGIIAVCTRNFVNLGPSTNNIGLDMGLVIGSFSGSVLVSLIAIKAVHWFHVPNHVLTIPSVIPMIPGV